MVKEINLLGWLLLSCWVGIPVVVMSRSRLRDVHSAVQQNYVSSL